jgi:hypothetical protein
MSDMKLVVRVKREGGRGHHLISRAKYEADPSAYVLCDEHGVPLAADPLDLADLRKQYRDTFGKGASPRWDADTIRAKLAEAKQE